MLQYPLYWRSLDLFQSAKCSENVRARRYLARTSACNDCHTPGYLMAEGNAPVDKWLTGDTFGWRGPWGTTYGGNLRLFMAGPALGGTLNG